MAESKLKNSGREGGGSTTKKRTGGAAAIGDIWSGTLGTKENESDLLEEDK